MKRHEIYNALHKHNLTAVATLQARRKFRCDIRASYTNLTNSELLEILDAAKLKAKVPSVQTPCTACANKRTCINS